MKLIHRFAEDMFRRLQSLPVSGLAIANLVLGVLVATANGIAFLLSLRGTDQAFQSHGWQMAILAIGGALLVLLSIGGYFRRGQIESILRLQTIILSGLVVWVLLLGIDALTHVNEVGPKTVWQFGLLTLLGAYCGFLVARSFLTALPLSRQATVWLTWIAVLAVLDFGIAVRVGT